MLRRNKFIIISILLSLLIHIAIILIKIRKPVVEEEKEYTEIEYINEKKVEPTPSPTPQDIPPPVIPPPIDDDRESTFDHDKITSSKESNIDEPDGSLLPESVESENDEIVNTKSDLATVYKPDILNTREITNRVARQKSVDREGEDTASYNKFEDKYASYFGKFRTRIYQIWKYPRESAMRGEKGVVGVQFSILTDGSIVNIKMIRSSGYHNLDREVMRVLKSFGKLPLPKSYKLNQLNVDEAFFFYDSNEDINRWIR